MSQRPAPDNGGSRNDPTPSSEPKPNLEPYATLASFDKLSFELKRKWGVCSLGR